MLNFIEKLFLGSAEKMVQILQIIFITFSEKKTNRVPFYAQYSEKICKS